MILHRPFFSKHSNIFIQEFFKQYLEMYLKVKKQYAVVIASHH